MTEPATNPAALLKRARGAAAAALDGPAMAFCTRQAGCSCRDCRESASALSGGGAGGGGGGGANLAVGRRPADGAAHLQLRRLGQQGRAGDEGPTLHVLTNMRDPSQFSGSASSSC